MERFTVLGQATTHGQAVPLGVDDPVVAARAVRRALAAAHRHASDVISIVVAAPEPIPAQVLAAFTRRALGPQGDTVGRAAIIATERDAVGLARRATEHAMASAPARAGVILVVGIAADGTSEARCLESGTVALQQPSPNAP